MSVQRDNPWKTNTVGKSHMLSQSRVVSACQIFLPAAPFFFLSKVLFLVLSFGYCCFAVFFFLIEMDVAI